MAAQSPIVLGGGQAGQTGDDMERQPGEHQQTMERAMIRLNPTTNLGMVLDERLRHMGLPERVADTEAATPGLLREHAQGACRARAADEADMAESLLAIAECVDTADIDGRLADIGAPQTVADALKGCYLIDRVSSAVDVGPKVDVATAMDMLGRKDWRDTRINPANVDFRP